MSWGSLSQFSPNLQQPMPTMATLSRMASGRPIVWGSYDPCAETATAGGRRLSRRCAPAYGSYLSNADGLDVRELADAVLGELAAVAGGFDATEGKARVGVDLG